MQRAYSPVHSDSDSDSDNNDATPVRRFRLSRDGHARATTAEPISPTRGSHQGSNGQDDLDRAMREFYAGPTRGITTNTSATLAQAAQSIASPTPQRHGSVSSSEHSLHSETHSRPSSSQHTFVEDPRTQTHGAPWAGNQIPAIPQQQSHIQYPNVQPRHAHTLPPIPTSSPLYPQHTTSTFAPPHASFTRPFSSASGPQIVPVQPWIDSRASSTTGWTPNSAYGHPFAAAHLAVGQVQPTGQRNSYLSHSSTPTHVEEDDYSEEEVEDELEVDRFHGQQKHNEKPFGGWNGAKNKMATPDSGDIFATPQPDTLHYGPAPVGAQVRRGVARKKISLTEGHMVLDLPVPSK